MSCERIMDKVYEQEDMPFLGQLRIGLHLFVCPDCAIRVERLEQCREILREDFMPASPKLENSIMAAIAAEEGALETKEAVVPGGFSIKGWVVAGLVLLFSLATIFFGMEANNIAAGMSFMLPIGITIGIVVTVYGALFIGSHLKKLSARFGLEAPQTRN